ncbi:DNA translocase FtsK 4TM domain-containing protein [Candidatus Saccharibacteria bacterium]|nr:DNA translocase FtsK 4TM domain-containing protein [Candidatus Saccharibacteria bacterium]
MAKKKKSSKKKVEAIESEKPVFWAIAGAVLLMVISIFLLLGMFGTGGSLPKGMYSVIYSVLGYAAVFSPIAAGYLGYLKFRSEDRRVPLKKLTGMLILIISVSCLMYVAFVSKSPTNSYEGGKGGGLGEIIGGVVLSALDKIPAIIAFLAISVFAFFWTFGISPKILLKPFEKKEKDTDLTDLKQKAEETEFKLNEGVPIEHHKKGDAAKLATFKNTAQKLTPTEDHEALTVANDPNWKLPSLDLLNKKQDKADPGDVEANADIIRETFSNFNISVIMEGANVGPRVTQYTLKPPTGVKLTKITALENNLALDLAAHSIRMEAPIPGKRQVGIEVPNLKYATVRLSSILSSTDWKDESGPLSFAIGKDISGQPIVSDLTKLPHILVAGQTGSGKSVMINTILTSLLYKNSPSDLKLILVDPKTVELAPYDDIPHLLSPVITEPEKCISALKWAVAEMERRYRTLAENRKRNIAEYNNLKKEEGMPYIVIVIDELADLMMMAARDVESLIVRIAQKARAVGIHLVLATQRPSVDVITGLIKANIPARIAFTTASQVDSRTIIDQIGAEKLLGQGDMLLLTADMPKPKRVQGAFISDEETNKISDFIRMQRPPEYDDEIISQPVQLNGRGGVVADYGGQDADDDMYKDAVRAVIEGRKASTSLLQRRLRIGYGRAARLIETMEEQGIISPADGNRPREVLVSSYDEVFGGANAGGASDEVYEENFPDKS